MGEELGKARERARAGAPLGEEPFFEQGLAQAEPREQVALVEGGGLFEALGGALGHAPLERRDVDVHRRGVEGEGRSLDEHDEGLRARHRPPKGREGMAEGVPGLCVARLAPEEGGELVPGVELPEGDGQVGQQRLDLAAGQARCLARPQSSPEPTE